MEFKQELTQAIEDLARETGLPVRDLINQAIELYKRVGGQE